MYSVNVDKLVKTSETQAESLLEITDNIIEGLGNHKAFAVLGGKVDTFKIAYNIMEKGNKVLFVDGDIRTDVFLGKYKLGKSAKGVLDYIKRPEKNEEIVCVTNHKNLSLIFTGINEDGVVTDDEIMIFKSLIDKYSKEYDYIVDAVDTVTAKIALVMKAKEMDIPIISSMGAGNKLDASKFEVADIYKTSVCPLAKVMRRELKKRGVKKLKVVYSREEPIKPVEDMAISCRSNCICPPGAKHKCTERRAIPGSVAFVPSVVGLIIAGEVVKDLVKDC